MGQSFQDRIQEACGRAGSAQALADKSGVSRRAIGKYLSGESDPSREILVKLAHAAGLQVEWLATGEGPKERGAMARISLARDAVSKFVQRRSSVQGDKVAELMQLAFEKEFDAGALERELGREYPVEGLTLRQPRADYAQIPLYDVRAAAGKGELVTTENPVDVLAFKEDWIRRELRVRPEDLRLIYVEGDSMEPDLRAGDIILVDHTDTSARREGIYVLLLDGALLVKTLQRLPGGVIRVISRNESYEPFSVKADELDTSTAIVIVGRVVWTCRRV
jgi:phage repressor protein C with HTH and peptisase S24 domain